MSALRLSIGKVEVVAYPLVSTRAVAVNRVVVRGHRIWATNDKGRIYCTDLGALRRRRQQPAILTLSEDDIFALGQLGLIDAATARALKRDELYRRDFSHQVDSLTWDANGLRDAGVKLPANTKTAIEAAAHKYAKAKASKRAKLAKAAK